MTNKKAKPELNLDTLKEKFVERMRILLPEEEDFNEYLKAINRYPVNSIRCNRLKISPDELKARLEKNYSWKIKQPWSSNKEVMVVENDLSPGEIGRTFEHLLGYYYVQELTSFLPVISLKPKEGESFLDLCASPGSKTTQAASFMNNKGFVIANEVSMGRLKILSSNLERNGVTNTIITKKDGPALCKRLESYNPDMKFDKILIDAPCSGEGTLRESYRTAQMWNPKNIKNLSRLQKRMVSDAIPILVSGGELVYSTCTHAPEENEEIVDFILENFGDEMEIQELNLPEELKVRQGIKRWQDKEYNEKVKKSARIYPQDNDTQGFFLAKFRKK